MKKTLLKVWDLYFEGFKNMKLGKVLWTIILIKLFVMFCILRPFFFPRYINTHADGEPTEFVAGELIDRGEQTEELN